jgi:hypothetical protein
MRVHSAAARTERPPTTVLENRERFYTLTAEGAWRGVLWTMCDVLHEPFYPQIVVRA